MGLGKKTIDDENYAGKRVLVRCDFNVPMKDGVITNDNRINAALPTIKKLIADGAKVILCSHLGKPKNGPEAKFSLAPVAVRLSEKLGQPVTFADDDNVVGNQAKAAVATMGNGDVVLLQNTRFRKEETKNIDTFSEELASLADAYVDDAFGSCHRAHCSTAGVTNYVKDTAVGYLMEKEIKYLGNAVNNPERPFTAILGGAKVADKLNVISNLLEKVDTLIIGGGMAYTFLKAQGYEIGKSLVDDSKIDYCKDVFSKDVAPGSIVELVPGVGSKVKEGRIVFVTINALTSQMAVIPEVEDLSFRQAYALLRARGFSSVEIEYVPGDYKDLAMGVELNGRTLLKGEHVPLTAHLVLKVSSGDPNMLPDSLALDSIPVEPLDSDIENWF